MNELNPAVIIGAWLLLLIITAIVFRIFFDIKKRLWIQQKQLDIMIKMAEKQGVSPEDIQFILDSK